MATETAEQGAADGSRAIVLAKGEELALPVPADRNPAAVYLASLGSEKSRTAQRSALDTIAKMLDGTSTIGSFPWSALRYQHVTALRARLADHFAPATVNRLLCAVRGVLREAMRLGQLSAEDCARACDVKSVKGSREPAGRALDSTELSALFRACDGATIAGARDAAILALLYGAGLRRSELAALTLSDVDAGTGSIRVIGKGNKERIVYATNGSLRAVKAWIAKRGNDAGALFPAVNKADRIVSAKAMTDKAVALLLARIATRAGVASFTPHDMRRTMISDLLDAGGDIATVQRLAGHAQVTTTQRYDRRGERAKLRTAELLRVPFDG
jgi:integrase/recombinase XerD